MILFLSACFGIFSIELSLAQASPVPPQSPQTCAAVLNSLPGKHDQSHTEKLCSTVKTLEGCKSVAGSEILWWEFPSKREDAKRILVIGLIHGDEGPSGTLTRQWMERLWGIDARNSWRFIPVSNPDGFAKKTRTNQNGVDLNRNFPTTDWIDFAHQYWEKHTKKNPRRFPGSEAGSEPETKCLLKHVQDFNPHLIVSVHTPYGLIDFDGPKGIKPRLPRLPFKALGTYPGSLGRLMWENRSVPVLTVELTQERAFFTDIEAGKFQDLLGNLVMDVAKQTAKEDAQKKPN